MNRARRARSTGPRSSDRADVSMTVGHAPTVGLGLPGVAAGGGRLRWRITRAGRPWGRHGRGSWHRRRDGRHGRRRGFGRNGVEASMARLDVQDADPRRSAPGRDERRPAAVRGRSHRGHAEADAGRVAAAPGAAPNFLVLHYHLAIWQSAPAVTFIVDGMTWGNDYPTVTTNESWFWHNQAGHARGSIDDGKLLMNLGDTGFAAYWKSSILAQVAAGDYDGVFADSASPALLQGEAQSPAEPRLAGTGARDTAIAELGGKTYIQAWEAFMTDFDAALAAQGVPLIPNTGAFITSWDNTDYSLTAGVFSRASPIPRFAPADWQRSTNQILSLVGQGQDRHPPELPRRLDRRGDAALLPRQLPLDERRPHLPRLLRRRAARVVPGVGRRPRRAGNDGRDGRRPRCQRRLRARVRSRVGGGEPRLRPPRR